MLKIDSPRISNKLYEIMKEVLISNSLVKFSKEFVENLLSEEENYVNLILIKNLNIIMNENKLHFKGYPSGNLIKIACKVLEYWSNFGYYPISFFKVEGLSDQTNSIIDSLNTQTEQVLHIIKFIRDSNLQSAMKIMINFLDNIGKRGFLTLIGIRTTVGSSETLPPKKSLLQSRFNKKYVKNKNNEYEINIDKIDYERSMNSSKITVGARAIVKHSERGKEKFWGICTGNLEEQNQRANELMKRMFEECIWINVHFLPHSKEIIEIRNSKGYGMRWEIGGEFRGLIEPQMDDGHKKKWKH